MNTATGTKQEKLSDEDLASRRRGMKLVKCGPRSEPFRISMSQDLTNSLRKSENPSASREAGAWAVNFKSGGPDQDTSSPRQGYGARSAQIAITLIAVTLAGVMVGILLRGGRE